MRWIDLHDLVVVLLTTLQHPHSLSQVATPSPASLVGIRGPPKLLISQATPTRWAVPLFAPLAKGEYHERIRNGVCAERTGVASAASLPALRQAQGPVPQVPRAGFASSPGRKKSALPRRLEQISRVAAQCSAESLLVGLAQVPRENARRRELNGYVVPGLEDWPDPLVGYGPLSYGIWHGPGGCIAARRRRSPAWRCR